MPGALLMGLIFGVSAALAMATTAKAGEIPFQMISTAGVAGCTAGIALMLILYWLNGTRVEDLWRAITDLVKQLPP